ncbi:DEAD box helicase, putative [Plasmodium gallinaceum]|uniref:DEAD box helicase, putative n=1 Tax=Plasmodium gallinaceum TaxID=5849 RepID=A0A1J1GS60_PLAGA|nr:DEAD box helicase, putative [Plasmodium gallinaceum]CRG95331.1 DEAD box helicase, putative [Plasmodium gallinaceum]
MKCNFKIDTKRRNFNTNNYNSLNKKRYLSNDYTDNDKKMSNKSKENKFYKSYSSKKLNDFANKEKYEKTERMYFENNINNIKRIGSSDNHQEKKYKEKNMFNKYGENSYKKYYYKSNNYHQDEKKNYINNNYNMKNIYNTDNEKNDSPNFKKGNKNKKDEENLVESLKSEHEETYFNTYNSINNQRQIQKTKSTHIKGNQNVINQNSFNVSNCNIQNEEYLLKNNRNDNLYLYKNNIKNFNKLNENYGNNELGIIIQNSYEKDSHNSFNNINETMYKSTDKLNTKTRDNINSYNYNMDNMNYNNDNNNYRNEYYNNDIYNNEYYNNDNYNYYNCENNNNYNNIYHNNINNNDHINNNDNRNNNNNNNASNVKYKNSYNNYYNKNYKFQTNYRNNDNYSYNCTQNRGKHEESKISSSLTFELDKQNIKIDENNKMVNSKIIYRDSDYCFSKHEENIRLYIKENNVNYNRKDKENFEIFNKNEKKKHENDYFSKKIHESDNIYNNYKENKEISIDDNYAKGKEKKITKKDNSIMKHHNYYKSNNINSYGNCSNNKNYRHNYNNYNNNNIDDYNNYYNNRNEFDIYKNEKKDYKNYENNNKVKPILYKDTKEIHREKTKKILLTEDIRNNAQSNIEKLSIYKSRDQIIEMINKNDITFIHGETGSGKSTCVPKFLFEENLKRNKNINIIITEPRRIACISLSKILSELTNEKLGEKIGYRISGESLYDNEKTVITYITIGYLFKLFLHHKNIYKKFTHVIIDEIHERSILLDIVLLFIKLYLHNKKKEEQMFKLIIMSATMQSNLFYSYFKHPNIKMDSIFIGTKIYNIDTFYIEDIINYTKYENYSSNVCSLKNEKNENSNNKEDYINESVIEFILRKKNCKKLHLSSSSEMLLHKIKNEYDKNIYLFNNKSTEHIENKDLDVDEIIPANVFSNISNLCLELVYNLCLNGDSVLIFLSGMQDITDMYHHLSILINNSSNNYDIKFNIYMLHSCLYDNTIHKLKGNDTDINIFLSSNIAESSITIPNVRLVIDFCIQKNIEYNAKKKAHILVKKWINKSSMEQRKGRCGRTCHGICIRMISKHFLNLLRDHKISEIYTHSLHLLYLYILKSMYVLNRLINRNNSCSDNTSNNKYKQKKLTIYDVLSMIIEKPSKKKIKSTKYELEKVKAIIKIKNKLVISIIGQIMIRFNLTINFCRLLLYGIILDLTFDSIIIISILITNDIFPTFNLYSSKNIYSYGVSLQLSLKQKSYFDGKTYSEPIMLRNVFLEWLCIFLLYIQTLKNENKFNKNDLKSYYINTCTIMNKKNYINAKKLLCVINSVENLSRKVLKILNKNSNAYKSSIYLLKLLRGNICENVNVKNVFFIVTKYSYYDYSNQNLYLKFLLSLSFTPLFIHGTPNLPLKDLNDGKKKSKKLLNVLNFVTEKKLNIKNCIYFSGVYIYDINILKKALYIMCPYLSFDVYYNKNTYFVHFNNKGINNYLNSCQNKMISSSIYNINKDNNNDEVKNSDTYSNDGNYNYSNNNLLINHYLNTNNNLDNFNQVNKIVNSNVFMNHFSGSFSKRIDPKNYHEIIEKIKSELIYMYNNNVEKNIFTNFYSNILNLISPVDAIFPVYKNQNDEINNISLSTNIINMFSNGKWNFSLPLYNNNKNSNDISDYFNHNYELKKPKHLFLVKWILLNTDNYKIKKNKQKNSNNDNNKEDENNNCKENSEINENYNLSFYKENSEKNRNYLKYDIINDNNKNYQKSSMKNTDQRYYMKNENGNNENHLEFKNKQANDNEHNINEYKNEDKKIKQIKKEKENSTENEVYSSYDEVEDDDNDSEKNSNEYNYENNKNEIIYDSSSVCSEQNKKMKQKKMKCNLNFRSVLGFLSLCPFVYDLQKNIYENQTSDIYAVCASIDYSCTNDAYTWVNYATVIPNKYFLSFFLSSLPYHDNVIFQTRTNLLNTDILSINIFDSKEILFKNVKKNKNKNKLNDSYSSINNTNINKYDLIRINYVRYVLSKILLSFTLAYNNLEDKENNDFIIKNISNDISMKNERIHNLYDNFKTYSSKNEKNEIHHLKEHCLNQTKTKNKDTDSEEIEEEDYFSENDELSDIEENNILKENLYLKKIILNMIDENNTEKINYNNYKIENSDDHFNLSYLYNDENLEDLNEKWNNCKGEHLINKYDYLCNFLKSEQNFYTSKNIKEKTLNSTSLVKSCYLNNNFSVQILNSINAYTNSDLEEFIFFQPINFSSIKKINFQLRSIYYNEHSTNENF